MTNLEQEIGSWDSVLLENISEDYFISNLHQRYKRDQIYTYIGTFLISINPYKPLSLYTTDHVRNYSSKAPFQLPPHIFAVTNSAYQWLQDHNEDQCIILSGESGSGKTEQSRMIVHFLTKMFELRRRKSAPNTPTKERSNSLSSSKEFISIPTTPKMEKNSCLVKSDDCLEQKFGSLKKCVREKTVDFDFSHRSSTENLTETLTKCQKHSGLMKNCPKHNPQLTVPKCNSCLTKTNSKLNSDKKIYYQSKSIENHQSCSSSLPLKKSNSVSSTCLRNKCAKNLKCFCKSTTATHSPSPKEKNLIFPKKKLNWGPSIPLDTKTDSSCDLEVQRIRDRISQVEIFLEALGNAKTRNNFNSSRFGKFYEIEFDFKGDPIGGHITHYMLEKSRITNTNPGERNFHIFYQLLSGADIQFLKSLKLQRNIDKYEILKNGCTIEDGKNNFIYTKKSLEILGLPNEEINSIFKIIAAILKLGNLIFVPTTNIDGTEGCVISNEFELHETAQLLQINDQILLNSLTRGDINWSQLDCGPELDAVHAKRLKNVLCRTLYGRLFTWVINRINESIKLKQYIRGKSLGILDFYGFENLENNSFEQLAINYSNEKLHQSYIQTVLKHQQDIYLKEGLEWQRVDFYDNNSICELIDKSNYGILSILEEPQVVCNDSFLTRLYQCCSGNPNFSTEDIAKKCFQVRHFAGPVNYSVHGFREKNLDVLSRNISSSLFQSKLPLVQKLFPEGNPKRSSKKPTTLGNNIKTSLQTLNSILDNRKCHYVFCIKPNETKQCRVFELALVQHQVRYMSLMPLVNLWRTGQCFNMSHLKFLNRYKLLSVTTWPHFNKGNLVEGIAVIIRTLPLPTAEFTIGRDSVFIRSPRTVFELEEFRKSRLDDLATLIQTQFRSYSKRKSFLKMKKSQIIISSAWRTWRECRFGIPFTGRRHLWGLYRVAKEEYRLIKYRKQVDWAMNVIQRQYYQWKRRQFLLTLTLRLPADSSSPLCNDWPVAPRFLTETSQLLRNIHHRWRCYKYRRSFDQISRNRMREKVTASIIFKERKASYAKSVSHPFLGDYVRLRQNVQWKKISVESNDQYVVFADIINKITRSSGKFVPVLLVLSTSSMLLLDQRTLQVKYRVPASEIYRLSLSPYLDDIAVFHVKADFANTNQLTSPDPSTGCLFQSELGRKKGDFVFQTGHVMEIVTKLFLVIQNATTKPPEVHISTEFEANFGQQTVVFAFKCGGGGGVSEIQAGQPKVTRKGNRMEIIV